MPSLNIALVAKVQSSVILLTKRIVFRLLPRTLLLGCSPSEYTVAIYESNLDGVRVIVTDIDECDVRRPIECCLEVNRTKYGPFPLTLLECHESFEKANFEIVSNDAFIVFRRVGTDSARIAYDRAKNTILDPKDLPDGAKRFLEEANMNKPELDD